MLETVLIVIYSFIHQYSNIFAHAHRNNIHIEKFRKNVQSVQEKVSHVIWIRQAEHGAEWRRVIYQSDLTKGKEPFQDCVSDPWILNERNKPHYFTDFCGSRIRQEYLMLTNITLVPFAWTDFKEEKFICFFCICVMWLFSHHEWLFVIFVLYGRSCFGGGAVILLYFYI